VARRLGTESSCVALCTTGNGGGGCLEGNPTLTAKCHQCFVIVSQLVSQLVSHEPHNAWVYT